MLKICQIASFGGVFFGAFAARSAYSGSVLFIQSPRHAAACLVANLARRFSVRSWRDLAMAHSPTSTDDTQLVLPPVKHVPVSRCAGPSKRRIAGLEGVVKPLRSRDLAAAHLHRGHHISTATSVPGLKKENTASYGDLACIIAQVKSPDERDDCSVASGSSSDNTRDDLYLPASARPYASVQHTEDSHTFLFHEVPRKKRSGRIPVMHAQLLLHFWSEINTQASATNDDLRW